jgi:hypothetical protein
MKINLKLYEAIYSSKLLIQFNNNVNQKIKLVDINILIGNLKQLLRNLLFLKKIKGNIQIFASPQQKYLMDVYKKNFLKELPTCFIKPISSTYSTKLANLEIALIISGFNNKYSSQLKNIMDRNFLILTEINSLNLKNFFKTYKIDINTFDNEKLFFVISLINKIIKNK